MRATTARWQTARKTSRKYNSKQNEQKTTHKYFASNTTGHVIKIVYVFSQFTRCRSMVLVGRTVILESICVKVVRYHCRKALLLSF